MQISVHDTAYFVRMSTTDVQQNIRWHDENEGNLTDKLTSTRSKLLKLSLMSHFFFIFSALFWKTSLSMSTMLGQHYLF